ncbi:hypothetical protein EW093_12255 [Thiospirochaeta perfilievii]|uniref:Extracellular solute-binding protein n=1 Tax=Thiospirochaeta perfilievii TaxID=252967 RepID=A0A5C1QBK9_9SPIO|nr:hypothetical protein [Thiospirochaeta perfilievii]QEN05453.1 hypothetical protein EW093_12255 [Thiospirochaeta perfilievii]
MKKLILLLITTLFISCSENKIETVTLYTDLPHILPFIENFNKHNDDIKIILELNPKNNYDITIFSGQKDSSQIETADITDLLETGKIKKELFYSEVLNLAKNDKGEFRVLPLTFDLPGVIYNRHTKKHPTDINIDDFINNKKSIFSPYWNSDFILWFYLSLSPEFNIEDSYFDKKEFTYTAKTMLNLLNDDSLNYNDFNNKYLHLSPELLLKDKIIDYYYSTLSNFLNSDINNFKDLAFSFLSKNNLINTADRAVFIGINSNSKKIRSSKKVLTWMFNKDNQEQFIKENFNSSGLYKLFNKELSTLIYVSKSVLPQYYPELRLLMPNNNEISAYLYLPELWDSLKDELLNPMFNDIISLDEDKWEKKYIEYFNDWSKKQNK